MSFGDGKVLPGLLGPKQLSDLKPEEHIRLELALAVKMRQSQLARLPQAIREELGAGLARMYLDQACDLPAGSIYLCELSEDDGREGKAGQLVFLSFPKALSEGELDRESKRLHGSSLWLIRP